MVGLYRFFLGFRAVVNVCDSKGFYLVLSRSPFGRLRSGKERKVDQLKRRYFQEAIEEAGSYVGLYWFLIRIALEQATLTFRSYS